MAGRISVVLPCYNEKENILALVPVIHKVLKEYEHEILVVDDNSPDGTYSAIKEKNYNYVVPLLRTTDRGFAKSIRCGIENASGDIIVVMDSDFNHMPKYIPILIDNIKHFDCVIASRFLYLPLEKHDSVSRIVSSWFFNLFIRIVLFSKITENLFGFYAIKKTVIHQMDFDEIFWGFGDYYIRLMYYLQKKNYTILQIPAIFGERNSGVGNKGLFRRIMRYTKETIILRFKKF
jgi:dolichol-phosphate mannosyltransferase